MNHIQQCTESIWPERHIRALMLVLIILTMAGFGGWIWHIRSVIKVPSDGTVAVVSANFGENCGLPKNNMLEWARSTCNGKKRCDLLFDWDLLGWGLLATAPTCTKWFRFEWKCSLDGRIFYYTSPKVRDRDPTVPLSCAQEDLKLLEDDSATK
jgi:hypothetical protein